MEPAKHDVVVGFQPDILDAVRQQTTNAFFLHVVISAIPGFREALDGLQICRLTSLVHVILDVIKSHGGRFVKAHLVPNSFFPPVVWEEVPKQVAENFVWREIQRVWKLSKSLSLASNSLGLLGGGASSLALGAHSSLPSSIQAPHVLAATTGTALGVSQADPQAISSALLTRIMQSQSAKPPQDLAGSVLAALTLQQQAAQDPLSEAQTHLIAGVEENKNLCPPTFPSSCAPQATGLPQTANGEKKPKKSQKDRKKKRKAKKDAALVKQVTDSKCTAVWSQSNGAEVESMTASVRTKIHSVQESDSQEITIDQRSSYTKVIQPQQQASNSVSSEDEEKMHTKRKSSKRKDSKKSSSIPVKKRKRLAREPESVPSQPEQPTSGAVDALLLLSSVAAQANDLITDNEA